MAYIQLLRGKGTFTGNDGNTITYPIEKLVLANDAGEKVEIKLDKMTKRLIPYLFKVVKSGELVQDDNYNELELYYLEEKMQKPKELW